MVFAVLVFYVALSPATRPAGGGYSQPASSGAGGAEAALAALASAQAEVAGLKAALATASSAKAGTPCPAQKTCPTCPAASSAVGASAAAVATTGGACVQRGANVCIGKSQCKPPKALLDRSYAFREHYPIPAFRLVLERAKGTCDLQKIGHPEFCRALANGNFFEPEFHVREVFTSFLAGCGLKDCYSIDLGSNTGYTAAYMAAMGSKVVAVEPQPFLAEALTESAKVNCWDVEVKNGFITHDDAKKGTSINVGSTVNGWRPVCWDVNPSVCLRRTGVNTLPLVGISDLVRGKKVDMVKVDIDSIDLCIMGKMLEMIKAKETEIENIVVEANGPRFHKGTSCPDVVDLMFAYQRAGYHIYRLNCHMDVRFFDSYGYDVYSGMKPIDWSGISPLLQEVYSQRLMRYAVKIKDEPDRSKWTAGIDWTWSYDAPQYMLTKQKLEEPIWEHPVIHELRKADANARKYVAPKDGIGPIHLDAHGTNYIKPEKLKVRGV